MSIVANKYRTEWFKGYDGILAFTQPWKVHQVIGYITSVHELNFESWKISKMFLANILKHGFWGPTPLVHSEKVWLTVHFRSQANTINCANTKQTYTVTTRATSIPVRNFMVALSGVCSQSLRGRVIEHPACSQWYRSTWVTEVTWTQNRSYSGQGRQTGLLTILPFKGAAGLD